MVVVELLPKSWLYSLFLFPTKSSIANHLFTFVYLSQMKILPLQPAGTAESAGLDSGEALQTQASTEDAGKEQQKLPLGVLKLPVEFTLTERSWAIDRVLVILDLSGGTAWTWSGAPNWRGKGPRFFVDLLCLWLLKRQQHNMSCLETYFSWQICFEGHTQSFWDVSLLGQVPEQPVPPQDWTEVNMSSISAYWRTADVVKCSRKILRGQL